MMTDRKKKGLFCLFLIACGTVVALYLYWPLIIGTIRTIWPPIVKNHHSALYHGIDVSHHNGRIDWAKVAQDTSIQFIYIKATEGATYINPMYQRNVREAKKNGLRIGSYHYFKMTSSARAQFKNIKNNIDKGKQDLIPMIDVETTDGHPIKEVRDSLRVLLTALEDFYGVKPIIYGTNKSYNRICGKAFNSHILYLGRYGNKPPEIKGKEHYTIWQFSEKGSIKGIPRPVDLCRFHPECTLESILLK